MREDLNEQIKASIIKRLSEEVRLTFDDNDDTRYPDLIKVTIKGDDYARFRQLSDFDMSKLSSKYKDYEELVKELNKYNIPYDTGIIEIEY